MVESEKESRVKDHWKRYILNTAGEPEQEMLSRKANLIEFFFIMTLVLVDLWFIAYPAVLLGIKWLNILSIVILVIGVMFLFFISPNLHKDEFNGWGLGNPVNLVNKIKESDPKKRYTQVIIISIIIGGLIIAGYVLWTEVADFLGINQEDATALKQNPGGSALIIGLLSIVALLFATICIRYDNFWTALKTAFLIIIPLGAFMLILGPIVNGVDVLLVFNAADFALNVFGYIFWGFIQQLLFSSYFGTRLRKGVGPADNLDSSAQKKRRWAVAFINGSFFGLLHIPSWWLLLGTWILGIFLSFVFMEDKNRNLVALGFIHGFLGSMLGWLFSSEEAEGGLDVEMSVGPWNVEYFDLSIFIVVGILVALFIAAMIYIYKKWGD